MFILKVIKRFFITILLNRSIVYTAYAFHRVSILNNQCKISRLSFIRSYHDNVFIRADRGYLGNRILRYHSNLTSVYNVPNSSHNDYISENDDDSTIQTDVFNGEDHSSKNGVSFTGDDSIDGGSSVTGDVRKDNREVLVFSDFIDLYKDLHSQNKLDSTGNRTAGGTVDSVDSVEDSKTMCITDPELPGQPIFDTNKYDNFSEFDQSSYDLAKRQFVKRLFKKLPQIVETKLFLVRSKGYVKGRVGSKCDLSIFDSNKVSTKPELSSKDRRRHRSHKIGTLESIDRPDQTPFSSISSVLPGVFTGLHTLKHTKKRIIRELKVKLDLYVKTLSSQLKNVTAFYKELVKYIHPFQYNLFRTTIYNMYTTGDTKVTFDHLLLKLTEAKKELVTRGNEINKQLHSTGSKSTGKGGITRCREAFNYVKVNIFQLDSLYSSFQNLYDEYGKYYRELNRLPVIDIEKPIVAIIGYANIGKTTLYNRLSDKPEEVDNGFYDGADKDLGSNGSSNSGSCKGAVENESEAHNSTEQIGTSLGLMWSNIHNSPVKKAKVADYKFTTRGINKCTLTYGLNNFIYEGQLVDTPGLLWRNGHTNYNAYERLTYSVLKDLPCGVIFCFNTNESLDDQINLHTYLRNRFPHRPWLNVVLRGDKELKDLEDETVKSEECQSRINGMFTRLHEILNL